MGSRRSLRTTLPAALIGLACAVAPADAAQSAPTPPRPAVAHVVRASYRRQPENPPEVTARHLGSGDRGRVPSDLTPVRRRTDAPAPARLLPVRGSGPARALALTGTALLLVALAGALVLLGQRVSGRGSRRHRRRSADARVDQSAMWTVDRALRALVAECARTAIPVPNLYLVTVSGEHITLGLTAPRATAPPPWVVTDAGRRWTGALRELQTMPINDHQNPPCPQLIALGEQEDALVLLDVSQAHGVISISGDTAAVSGLIQEWERQLHSNPWARPATPVVHVGAPPSPQPGTVVVQSLAAAVEEVAEQRDGVLFVTSSPTRRDRNLLGALVRAPDASWTVVVGSEVELARWRFAVSRDGLLDTEFLDAPVATRMVPR